MLRVARYDPMSVWDIDMAYLSGRSDIIEISMRISIWDLGSRFGIRYIDMVIYHIDMVVLDIDMGYELMIWEMTVSIWLSSILVWDILSLCLTLVSPSWMCVHHIPVYPNTLTASSSLA
jgi:hypothetical protein